MLIRNRSIVIKILRPFLKSFTWKEPPSERKPTCAKLLPKIHRATRCLDSYSPYRITALEELIPHSLDQLAGLDPAGFMELRHQRPSVAIVRE
ncbi:hypothetical protein TNCT_576151 [Trichonephila clavata]|uniref:Uncharacterized protein n=1 Tax=Trichonephila clavata TaxID=2740835 RepID=A0A8X6LMY1_TRICU|nr:hypothetical protein TNCT_576151 [Trichonephila clavata]